MKKRTILLTLAILMNMSYTNTSSTKRDGQIDLEPIGGPVVGRRQGWPTPRMLTLAEMEQNVLNNFAHYIRNNSYSKNIELLADQIEDISSQIKVGVWTTIIAFIFSSGLVLYKIEYGIIAAFFTILQGIALQTSTIKKIKLELELINEKK